MIGIGRAYVLRRSTDDDAALPLVLGFYTLSCTGIIVDAKDEIAERFYAKYDFATGTNGWPRRMFLPISTVRAVFED